MFDIAWAERDVLNVKMSGFFSIPEIAALEDETTRLVISRPDGCFYGLAELALLPVQRPEVVLRLRALLSTLRAAGMSNGAMVINSVLVKLQTRRAVDFDRAAYFTTRADALAWISERRLASSGQQLRI